MEKITKNILILDSCFFYEFLYIGFKNHIISLSITHHLKERRVRHSHTLEPQWPSQLDHRRVITHQQNKAVIRVSVGQMVDCCLGVQNTSGSVCKTPMQSLLYELPNITFIYPSVSRTMKP